MIVRDTRVYQGPNLYANFRVIRMTVDLGKLEAWPSAKPYKVNLVKQATTPTKWPEP